jgi:hypothetical protein
MFLYTWSFDCSVCKLGKSKTLSFPSHVSRAAKCFDIVHSDVWGISPKSSVPSKFWVEALSTVVYLINRLPSWILILRIIVCTISILAILFYILLDVFVLFIYLLMNVTNSAHSVKCAFMGYSFSHKGYVCYDSCTNKFRIPRNVVFFENQCCCCCLRLVFYLVLMICHLFLTGSNLELFMLDVDQLCPFSRLTLHPKLFRQLLLRLACHPR